MANAAGRYLDANLAWPRRRNFPFSNFKVTFGFGNLRHFHVYHLVFTSRVRWMCVASMPNDFAGGQVFVALLVLGPMCSVAACGQAERIRILAARLGGEGAGGEAA